MAKNETDFPRIRYTTEEGGMYKYLTAYAVILPDGKVWDNYMGGWRDNPPEPWRGVPLTAGELVEACADGGFHGLARLIADIARRKIGGKA